MKFRNRQTGESNARKSHRRHRKGEYVVCCDHFHENCQYTTVCKILFAYWVTGTPLLLSTSPYTQLPDGLNWSVGVSDVILLTLKICQMRRANTRNLAGSLGRSGRLSAKSMRQTTPNAMTELNDWSSSVRLHLRKD